MRNLYRDVESIIHEYIDSPVVRNLDFLPDVHEKHLITLFESFLDEYSGILPEDQVTGDGVGMLVTTNRIIVDGNENLPLKITILNDEPYSSNSYLYSIRKQQVLSSTDTHNIVILRDNNRILYRVHGYAYPADFTFEYEITKYGLDELQSIILKHGYLPAFDSTYIALIPLSALKDAKIEKPERQFTDSLKQLVIDTNDINWLPMFITPNNISIINENTVADIISAVPPEKISIDLDHSYINFLSQHQPFVPELTGILLQLSL